MSRDDISNKLTSHELRTTGPRGRDISLLDAAVTAAALVACADGRITTIERQEIVERVIKNPSLSAFTPAEVAEAFDQRVRTLEQEGGAEIAVRSLARSSASAAARLIIRIAEEVAAAQDRSSVHELRMLQLVRIALSAEPIASPRVRYAGGAR